jgi:Dyp-type peroxidase family
MDSKGNLQRFLRDLTDLVTSAETTLTTRRLRSPRPAGEPQSRAWVNVGLSYRALATLTTDVDRFRDGAFRSGLAERSRLLGDPQHYDERGSPSNWVVGGHGREADCVLLVSAQDVDTLDSMNRDLLESLGRASESSQQGRVLFRERCSPSRAREHFGFTDNISQPGVRGRFSTDKRVSISPISSSIARVGGWADLVWPGEFVFGYPRQDPHDLRAPWINSGDEVPKWARNGSYLVVRRLYQDVFAFHCFVRQAALDRTINPELLCARMIGRWPSGIPLILAPRYADAQSPKHSRRLNDFVFANRGSYGSNPKNSLQNVRVDRDGDRCPISAHIRKMNPRGITSIGGKSIPNPADTQCHRILRRGLPYGPISLSSTDRPIADGVDRGLLFMSYQASIERQFEFLARRWANESNFPEPLSGHDPIIGQNAVHSRRQRMFYLDAMGGRPVTTRSEWVIPTGGGYFFAPGLRGLRSLSSTR